MEDLVAVPTPTIIACKEAECQQELQQAIQEKLGKISPLAPHHDDPMLQVIHCAYIFTCTLRTMSIDVFSYGGSYLAPLYIQNELVKCIGKDITNNPDVRSPYEIYKLFFGLLGC